MLKIDNMRIRFNKSESGGIVGWVEFLMVVDGEYLFKVDNCELRRKQEGKDIRLVMMYPRKVIERNGVREVKYYVKPINKETYGFIEREMLKVFRGHQSEARGNDGKGRGEAVRTADSGGK